MKCKATGHDWHGVGQESAAYVLVDECFRCGLVRKRAVRGGKVQYEPGEAVKEAAADEAAQRAQDEEEASRICIWCGKVCESLEALDLHEEECQP